MKREMPTGTCAVAVEAVSRAMKTTLEVKRIAAHLIVSRPRRQGGNVTAGGPDRKDQTVRVGRSQYRRLWAILGKPGIAAGHHEAGLWKKFVICRAASPTQTHLSGRHARAGKRRGLRKQGAGISHIASQAGDNRN